MTVSAKPIRLAPLWIKGTLLAVAVVSLPLSVAQAQSPDFDAVGARLIRAVQAGELADWQAEEMMATLARARFAQQMEESHERPARSARGDGRDRRGERDIEKHFEQIGVDEDVLEGIVGHLHEGGLEGEQVHRALAIMLRLAHGMAGSDDEGHNITDAVSKHLHQQGLNDDQIEMVHDIATWLADRVREGHEEDEHEQRRVRHRDDRTREVNQRERDEQRRERVAEEREQRRRQRDPDDNGVRRGGLTDEQAEGIESRYLEMGFDELAYDRIVSALESRGIEDEQTDLALAVMLRIVAAIQRAGDDFKPEPEMVKRLTEMGFRYEQVEMLIGFSRRLAGGLQDRNGDPRREEDPEHRDG